MPIPQGLVPLRCALTLLVIFAGSASAQIRPPAPQTRPSTRPAYVPTLFLKEVADRFSAWDLDSDGRLNVDEIETAVASPQVRPSASATAAALRRAVRGKFELTTLTYDQLKTSIPYKPSEKPQPNYESMYRTAISRITQARRELFVSELPKLESIAQGRMGDCYLLSMLGATVYRHPQRVRQMLKATPDGRYEVAFGNGRRVVIPPPTDAEIAIGASTRGDGLWAVVYEKAVGHLYLASQKKRAHVAPFSIIGNGGSTRLSIQLITGHVAERSRCNLFQAPQSDASARQALLAEIRTRLADTLRHDRLVGASTADLGGKQTIVPGITYKHSYAVLEYDPQLDLVTFWNPNSNKFSPKGPAGLKEGYPTELGRFRAPLTEAVMWLDSFSFETDKPLAN